MAQAVTYVATAPKSNRSYEAVSQAMQEVHATGDLPIPTHLQDAHYKGAAKLGHGTGYKYAHDYPNDYVEQQYLPYELSGREFYQPSGNGYEVKIREHMARIKKEAAEASSETKNHKIRYLIAGLEQLRNQVFVYFLVFFLPVVADGCGGFFHRYGESNVYQADTSVFCHEVSFVFAGSGFIIISENRYFISKCEFVLAEIGIDFLLDRIADAVFEEIQSFFSFGSDGQMRTVTDGLRGDHTGIGQFVDHLLQRQEVGIFFS